jgi:predicted nucleotidyltransferase
VSLDPNLGMVERIAAALGPLRDRVVFVGGSATGLLITDLLAAAIRVTKDVDVIVEVATQGGYYQVEKALRAQGFRNDTSEGAPLCRWCWEDLLLDVMPTDPAILGFSNQWYPEAVATAENRRLPGGLTIRLVAPPYFIATKLEAFFGRGKGDYFGSHDLEDLIAVVDGRQSIVEEVEQATPALRSYLGQKLGTLLGDPIFSYAVEGHLPGDPGSQARVPDLLQRLRTIASLEFR